MPPLDSMVYVMQFPGAETSVLRQCTFLSELRVRQLMRFSKSASIDACAFAEARGFWVAAF